MDIVAIVSSIHDKLCVLMQNLKSALTFSDSQHKAQGERVIAKHPCLTPEELQPPHLWTEWRIC